MLARFVGASCAVLIVWISLSLHTFRMLFSRKKLRAGSAGLEDHKSEELRMDAAAPFPSISEGRFPADWAIEAYEKLIDSTCTPVFASHVALVIPALDRIGGAERQFVSLAIGLHRRGWRVSTVVLSGEGVAAAAELAKAGVALASLGMRKGLADPRGWMRFIRWLRLERPDVVHAHLAPAAWLARWSRLFAQIPVVVDTLHSSCIGGIGRRWGYRVSQRLPDRVTAVSRSVAYAHLSAGMVKWEKLKVLHNGVDVCEWRPDERVRAAVRREMGLGDEFLWLAAGRLEMVKDYPTLLKAMAAIEPPARLVIAGCGPLLPNLARLAAHLGICERIKFLGFETNIKRWFQAADGFVLSSRWEGLPMVLLEAAACGLPTVATDVPGSCEIVLDGQTGTLVPPADVSALAWAMNAVMRTPQEERRAIGARARQRVLEQFGLDTCFDRWEELYGELFRGKSTQKAPKPVPAAGCASATGA